MAAAPHLPPITRESLKELYSKNPLEPLAKEFTESLNNIVEVHKNALSTHSPPLPLRVTREEEPPKRIDENLWRIREESEIIEEQTKKSLQSLASGSPEHSSMSNVLTNIKNVFTEVSNYQQNLVAETLKRVESFLPQDFRLSMIRYTKERKETAFKAEVDHLMSEGGSIEDKYKLLWAQQMQRRESLVQLSNASGVWKALISYIAGCPPELLDFLKQFNDPQGPMEEFRLAYGPTVYFVTRYIGRLRAAIAASKTITAEHAKLFEKASGDLAREVKRIMAFLFVVNVKKSPFFVDAEEDTDAQKEQVVAAWGAFEKHRPVHKGAKINWEFTTKSGDIGFAVAFTSASGVQEILGNKRYNSDKEAVKGEHTAPADGTFQLKWDNTYSWTTPKNLVYRIQVQGGSAPASPVVPPASASPK